MKPKAKHDLDESDIDEADELGEISGDDQEQLCSVWCRKHKKYEWHTILRPIGETERKKRKARRAKLVDDLKGPKP